MCKIVGDILRDGNYRISGDVQELAIEILSVFQTG